MTCKVSMFPLPDKLGSFDPSLLLDIKDKLFRLPDTLENASSAREVRAVDCRFTVSREAPNKDLGMGPATDTTLKSAMNVNITLDKGGNVHSPGMTEFPMIFKSERATNPEMDSSKSSGTFG